jgi:hypothetical protein
MGRVVAWVGACVVLAWVIAHLLYLGPIREAAETTVAWLDPDPTTDPLTAVAGLRYLRSRSARAACARIVCIACVSWSE